MKALSKLLKNTLRACRKSKIALITLTILVFLSLGIFCLINNMTTSIVRQFNNITNLSNLHSFTAHELYDNGNALFSPKFSGLYWDKNKQWHYEQDISKPSNDINVLINGDAKDNDGFARTLVSLEAKFNKDEPQYFGLGNLYCEINNQTDEFKAIRTYDIELSTFDSTGLYQYYAKNGNKDVVAFKITLSNVFKTTASNEANVFQEIWNNYIDTSKSSINKTVWKEDSDWQKIVSNKQTPYFIDYSTIQNEIDAHQNEIFSKIANMDISPLQDLLDEKYHDEVIYQNFNSLNVTATSEKIYYKIIESNQENQIDKIVLFDDKNNNQGYLLPKHDVWAPYDSKIIFYDLSNQVISQDEIIINDNLSLIIPKNDKDVIKYSLFKLDDINASSWNDEAKYLYTQVIHNRFKRMSTATFTEEKDRKMIEAIAAINLTNDEYYKIFFDQTNDVITNYNLYLQEYYDKEQINISDNGSIVFSWETGNFNIPSTCTIVNYTSFLSIANPEYLNAVNKKVITADYFASFKPYVAWSKATNHTMIDQQSIIDWFNWLTYDEFLFWKSPNHEKQQFKIPCNDEQQNFSIIEVTNIEWQGIDQNCIVECGGYNLIIWGCGISADFIYPVVEFTRPAPNVNKECLLYVNSLGFQSVKLSFVNSPTEQFLLCKFKPNVSDTRAKQIIDEINDWSLDNMIYPKNIKSAYFYNDTENILSPCGMRISFVLNFVRVIDIISNALCLLIAFIGILICFIVIKKFIDKNRITIGIMYANGFTKSQISFSLLPFALIPAIFGGVGAYLVSFFLQAATINIFSNYWMLPTPLLSFNVFSLLWCTLIPFIFFMIVSFFSTFNLLKQKVTNLMAKGGEFKTNAISRIAKQQFSQFGVLVRFRVSLAFNSLWRLLVLCMITTIAMCSLTFAIASFNKLNEAYSLDRGLNTYSYAISLTTPTASGGNYNPYYLLKKNGDNIETGYGNVDKSNYIFNVAVNTGDENETTNLIKPYYATDILNAALLGNFGGIKNASDPSDDQPITINSKKYHEILKNKLNLFFIDAISSLALRGDKVGQNEDLFYLKDRFSSQTILDYKLELATFGGSNPWDIALALMPINSRNLANKSFEQIIQMAGEKITNAQPNTGDKWYCESWIKKYVDKYHPDVVEVIFNDHTNNIVTFKKPYNAFSKFIYKDKNSSKYVLDKNHIWIFDPSYDVETNTLEEVYVTLGFNYEFLELLLTIFNDPEICKEEYPINYGSIPLNWDVEAKADETYTYIDSQICQISSLPRFGSNDKINIIGLAEDSQYISLLDTNDNSLNSLLFSDKNLQPNVYPLIINSYAAFKYNLKENDEIKIKAFNTVDRFEKMANSIENDKIETFKVVGITKSPANEKFYTSQKVANKILGLPDGQSWNKTHKYMIWTEQPNELWTRTGIYKDGGRKTNLPCIFDLAKDENNNIYLYKFEHGDEFGDNNHPTKIPFNLNDQYIKDKFHDFDFPIPIGFNGVFTTQTEGKPNTNVLSLYSYTGMYPGASTFKSNSSSNKFFEILTKQNNLAFANFLSGINDQEIYELSKKILNDAYNNNKDEINLSQDEQNKIEHFIDKIANIYGPTTVVTAINGAIDVHTLDQVYENLINTFNTITSCILSIIFPIAIIITILISNLVIDDSKRMAMMLKILGYNDASNATNFLSLYIPVIIFGLACAIPLAYGICFAYNLIIIRTVNIFINAMPYWWHHLVSLGAILATFSISCIYGYNILKRERLVDNINIIN